MFPVHFPFRPSFFRPADEPISPDALSINSALGTSRITSHVMSFKLLTRWRGETTMAEQRNVRIRAVTGGTSAVHRTVGIDVRLPLHRCGISPNEMVPLQIDLAAIQVTVPVVDQPPVRRLRGRRNR